jgi:hypothetical protein
MDTRSEFAILFVEAEQLTRVCGFPQHGLQPHGPRPWVKTNGETLAASSVTGLLDRKRSLIKNSERVRLTEKNAKFNDALRGHKPL